MLITLTTDFGPSSPYVGQIRGVLAKRVPSARVLDISHSVPPQNVLAGALVLEDTVPWFPEKTVHVGVVDPGVGTSRRMLAGRLEAGYVVGPDNGLFSLLPLQDVVSLDRPAYWNQSICPTFHGRDIFAPIAGALVSGVQLKELGTSISDWHRLDIPRPVQRGIQTDGSVLCADSFGNLITNLRELDLPQENFTLRFADQSCRFVQTYGQGEPNELVGLLGSSGRVEIAVVNGNALVAHPTSTVVSIVPHRRNQQS